MKLTDEILQYLNDTEKMNELGEKITSTVDEELVKQSIACRIMDLKEWDPMLVLKDTNSNLYMLEIATHNKGNRKVTPILNPGGTPTGQFMEAPERYTIPIGAFSSNRYWRTLNDIKTDSPPWTARIIADTAKNGIAGSIDGRFMELVQASVEATGQTIQYPDLAPSQATIISAMQMVMENSYASKLLIRKDDFLAMLKLDEPIDIDIDIDPKIIDDKLPYEACLIDNIFNQNATAKCEGMKVVLCDNDDDLIQPYHMYVFAMPEDIGKLYLGDTRVEMEKRFQVLQWEGSSTGGMNIADVFSIAEIVVNQPAQAKESLEIPTMEEAYTRQIEEFEKDKSMHKMEIGGEVIWVKDCRNDVTEVEKPSFWKKLFHRKTVKENT